MKNLILSALLLMGFTAIAQEPVKGTEAQNKNGTNDVRRFVSSQSVVTTTTTTKHGYRKKKPIETIKDSTYTEYADMSETKVDTLKARRILNYSSF